MRTETPRLTSEGWMPYPSSVSQTCYSQGLPCVLTHPHQLLCAAGWQDVTESSRGTQMLAILCCPHPRSHHRAAWCTLLSPAARLALCFPDPSPFCPDLTTGGHIWKQILLGFSSTPNPGLEHRIPRLGPTAYLTTCPSLAS